ncbi:hypothetical protein G9A89_008425 [Geosiphon pyriformis]|nr:hypothetical protein G9A89_008425 [Geosiphon pyriformis]
MPGKRSGSKSNSRKTIDKRKLNGNNSAQKAIRKPKSPKNKQNSRRQSSHDSNSDWLPKVLDSQQRFQAVADAASQIANGFRKFREAIIKSQGVIPPDLRTWINQTENNDDDEDGSIEICSVASAEHNFVLSQNTNLVPVIEPSIPLIPFIPIIRQDSKTCENGVMHLNDAEATNQDEDQDKAASEHHSVKEQAQEIQVSSKNEVDSQECEGSNEKRENDEVEREALDEDDEEGREALDENDEKGREALDENDEKGREALDGNEEGREALDGNDDEDEEMEENDQNRNEDHEISPSKENASEEDKAASEIAQEEIQFWSMDQREKLNEELIKYYYRRQEIDPATPADIANEIYALATEEIGIKVEKSLPQYLGRFRTPARATLCNAILKWIDQEKREHGEMG